MLTAFKQGIHEAFHFSTLQFSHSSFFGSLPKCKLLTCLYLAFTRVPGSLYSVNDGNLLKRFCVCGHPIAYTENPTFTKDHATLFLHVTHRFKEEGMVIYSSTYVIVDLSVFGLAPDLYATLLLSCVSLQPSLRKSLRTPMTYIKHQI